MRPGIRRGILVGLVSGLTAAGAASAQTLAFSDQTDAAGLTSTHTPPTGLPSSNLLGGIAVGDFDDDGWPDLFYPTGGLFPDRLFLNQRDGTFTEQAAGWGVDATHVAGGMAVGDYDNDGRLDLYVMSHGAAPVLGPGAHRLYHNEGSAFVDRASACGVETASPTQPDGYGAAFGDTDLDGDLDLFATGWVSGSEGNRYFRNESGVSFTDVTAIAIDVDLTDVHGFSPLFVDMDDDRDPELLLVADFFSSRYLVNAGDGTFVDATASAGTGLDSNGMGQAVGDLDGDGSLDWYVTSIHDAAGGSASGNMLYRAVGGNAFVETSTASGVNDGGWGWGTVAVDFDHDGRLDLAETNGWPGAQWAGEQGYLFLADGAPGAFTESAASVGLVHHSDGRGLAHFDYDRDGDQDLMFCSIAEPLKLWRNDRSGPGGHWLRVRLDNGGHGHIAPDGYGAKLELTAGGATQLRLVHAGGSYLSQSELVAHFGLGSARRVDTLRVTWPDGRVDVLEDLSADRQLTITYRRSGPVEADVGGPSAPGSPPKSL